MRAYQSWIVDLVCVLLVVLGVLARPRGADELVTANFVDSSVADANFLVGGSNWTLCLTARQATSQTPVPGCPAGGSSLPPSGDAPGSGAFAPDAQPQRLGRVRALQPGLAVHRRGRVRLLSYKGDGETRADGIAFFLADGLVDLTQPGAADSP